MKKVLVLTEESEKALVSLYDLAMRFAGCREADKHWNIVLSSVKEEIEKQED